MQTTPSLIIAVKVLPHEVVELARATSLQLWLSLIHAVSRQRHRLTIGPILVLILIDRTDDPSLFLVMPRLDVHPSCVVELIIDHDDVLVDLLCG